MQYISIAGIILWSLLLYFFIFKCKLIIGITWVMFYHFSLYMCHVSAKEPPTMHHQLLMWPPFPPPEQQMFVAALQD